MNTDKFSTGRLATMIRKNLTEGGRSLTLQLTVMVGVLALLTLFSSYFCFTDAYSDSQYIIYEEQANENSTYDPMWSILSIPIFLAGFIFAALSASQVGACMSTRPKRLVNLMTPALQSEKFLARWLIYTVGSLLIFFLAEMSIDLLRVALAKMMYPESHRIHWIAEYLFGRHSASSLLALLFVTLAFMSVYTLGSFIWPRRGFIATSVAMGVLTIALGLIAAIAASAMFESGFIYPRSEIVGSRYAIMTLSAAVAIGLNLLSYRRYTQDEVINRW